MSIDESILGLPGAGQECEQRSVHTKRVGVRSHHGFLCSISGIAAVLPQRESDIKELARETGTSTRCHQHACRARRRRALTKAIIKTKCRSALIKGYPPTSSSVSVVTTTGSPKFAVLTVVFKHRQASGLLRPD